MSLNYSRANAHVYDWLLLQWLEHMREHDELRFTFVESMIAPGNFLRYWMDTAKLMFEVDSTGFLCRAAWTDSFMRNAYFGLYLRHDVRRSAESLRFVEAAYAEAFTQYEVLFGLIAVHRPDYARLIASHRKIGYSEPVVVPYLFDGQPGAIVHVTQAMWDDAHATRKRLVKGEV